MPVYGCNPGHTPRPQQSEADDGPDRAGIAWGPDICPAP
jgi:hypothetical protein